MNRWITISLAAVLALALAAPVAQADVDCQNTGAITFPAAKPCVMEMIENYGDELELRAAEQAAKHAASQYMSNDDVNAGFAVSAAMASIPSAPAEAGRGAVGFGFGTAGGAGAVAVGISATVDENLSVRVTLASDFSGARKAVGFGAAIQW